MHCSYCCKCLLRGCYLDWQRHLQWLSVFMKLRKVAGTVKTTAWAA